jgi:hypothetical protein
MFNGNFADTGRVIYDPDSYGAIFGTRQPFPGGLIPGNRINPTASAFSKYYLAGESLTITPNNVSGNPRNTLNDDQEGIRLDMAPGLRQQLSVQLFHQNSPTGQPGLFPFTGLQYVNRSGLAMLQHTWSISPNLVNSLRAGFVSNTATGGSQGLSLGPSLSSIGVMNTIATQGVSEIDLQGYSSFGTSNGFAGNTDDSWHIGEEVSYVRGKHNLKFGGDLGYRREWGLNSNANALGVLAFQPIFTAQLTQNAKGQPVPQPGTGDSWADFLLGTPASGRVSGLPPVQYRSTRLHPFFQDTWRITRDLTLNYGISWYMETPPDPQGPARNFIHGFSEVTGLVTYAALRQLNPQAVATDRNNFAPRLGIAWKPGFAKSTVVRAGAGVYYSEFPWWVELFPLLLSPAFPGGTAFTNSSTNPSPQYVLGKNIFLPQNPATLTANYAASVAPGTLASGIDLHFRTGYISQWNLSVQRGLGNAGSVELSYLGASSHRLVNERDISQCRPAPDLYCSSATKPWPNYSFLPWIDSSGNSSYEGVIAKYERRTGKGLNLQIAYTFAKTLADAWQSSANPYAQIASCLKCDKGPASFDVRHRAVASAVWELPFGRGRRFGGLAPRAAEQAFGGWNIIAISTFATGQPLYLTAPNSTGGLVFDQLPDRVCDGRSSRLSSNVRSNGFLWFDTRCFPLASVGYFGNSGRTVVTGPGLNNWDIGVEKSFALTERDSTRLLFRGELFNAFNHTQFQQPDAGAGDGANFGRISGTRPARLIQLGLKVLW